MGRVLAICLSEARGTQKTNIGKAEFRENYGLVGDAHAGNWHRQVSLLSYEKIKEFREKGADVEFGAFGENLVVEGFDFRHLPVGTRFRCGDVVIEMTQIGKECNSHCAIYKTMGQCIMPIEGVFAKVISGGVIEVGDEMVKLEPVEKDHIRAAVITLSDRGFKGERVDKSGPIIVKMLENMGYIVEEQLLLSDDKDGLEKQLKRLADMRQVDLILTTGGTGFSKRDNTPEATMAVAERNAQGIAEAIRAFSLTITPLGMLSRGVSVLRGKTLIVNLPGSPKAVLETLNYILPAIDHGVRIANGSTSECGKYVN